MIVADCHVHLYPVYQVARLLQAAWDNLRRGCGLETASYAIFLTERADCHFFRDLVEGEDRDFGGWTWEAVGEPAAIRWQGPAGEELWMFCGRQVVTAERMELLAWLIDDEFIDGQPIREVQSRILELGGVPALPWSPGKWVFSRAKVAAQLVKASTPETLVLVDSSLRPIGWPEPMLMRDAAGKGFPVLAGTDPLPGPGEEAQAGRLAVRIDAHLDPASPVASCRSILQQGGQLKSTTIGRRMGPIAVWKRMRCLSQVTL